MSAKPKILVFAGSAREGSLNKKLSRAAKRSNNFLAYAACGGGSRTDIRSGLRFTGGARDSRLVGAM